MDIPLYISADPTCMNKEAKRQQCIQDDLERYMLVLLVPRKVVFGHLGSLNLQSFQYSIGICIHVYVKCLLSTYSIKLFVKCVGRKLTRLDYISITFFLYINEQWLLNSGRKDVKCVSYPCSEKRQI